MEHGATLTLTGVAMGVGVHLVAVAVEGGLFEGWHLLAPRVRRWWQDRRGREP